MKFFLSLLICFTINISYTISQENPSITTLSTPVLDSLAQLYLSNRQFSQAILYLDEAIKRANKLVEHKDSVLKDNYSMLAYSYKWLPDDTKAEATYLKLIELYENSGVENQDYLVELSNFSGVYQQMGRYKDAVQLLEKVLAKAPSILEEGNTLWGNFYNNTATSYKSIGKWEEAVVMQKKALAIYITAFGEENPNIAVLKSNLAGLYRDMERLEEAEPLYEQAKELSLKVYGKEHLNYAQTLNNMAVLHWKKKDYTQAEAFYKEVLFIYKKNLGDKHPSYALALLNLSIQYLEMKRWDNAEAMLLEAESIYKHNYGETHSEYAAVLNKLGRLYLAKGLNDQAEQYYLKAIAILNLEVNKGSIVKIVLLRDLAEFYNNLEKPELAKPLTLEALGLAMVPVVDNYETIESNIEQLAKEAMMNPALEVIALLKNLVLSNELFYRATKDIKYLKLNYSVINAQSTLLNRFQNDLQSGKDKLKLFELTAEVAEMGIINIETLQHLDPQNSRLDRVFEMVEFNKSALLSSSLKEDNAFHFGEVPDSLVKKDNDIKKTLSRLDKEKQEAYSKKDSVQLTKVNNELVNNQKEQEKLSQFLEKNYPKYYHYKYENKLVSIKEIQDQLLSPTTALLEYFIYDTTAYLLAITQQKVELIPLDLSQEVLTKQVELFRKGISDYNLLKNSFDKSWQYYTESAFFFYQKLVAPALKNQKNITSLIIVPDNLLGNIPFEALLLTLPNSQNTEKIDYKKLDFLLNHYTISYSYSASLRLENKLMKRPKAPNDFLIIAADYPIEKDTPKDTLLLNRSLRQTGIRNGLGALPAAFEEATEILNLVGGTFLNKLEASEQNFKKIAGDYKVIHLAMHGLLDEKNPLLSSLVFTENKDSLEDNFLETHEISTMNLNAELVILSACETGYGKFKQGEGVMSLARSFMYAGVPSLVVSLWQVNDAATSLVMQEFYKNLKSGMTKSAALREAKLSYINMTTGITGHPAFWSAFIQIGDDQPIHVGNNSMGIWMLLGLAIVVLLGGVLFVSLKKREKLV